MNQQASSRMKKILQSSAALVAFAGIICLILAVLCITFTAHISYASIWVVNAVLLIFIFRSPPALIWPYFAVGLLANILANMIGGATPLQALEFSICNNFEILLPILCVPRYDNEDIYIKGFDFQSIMLLISVPVGCLLAAASAAAITINIWQPDFIKITFGWFSIDLLAMMAILPLGLSATQERIHKLMQPAKLTELIIVALITIGFTWISLNYIQIKFIIILMPLLYAAFRLGLLGTSTIFFCTAATYVTGIMISSLMHAHIKMPEIISYSFILMCITLIPALITAILIEQRDEFEEKLRANEQLFRSAVKYTAIGMALISPKGKWLVVNPALCAISGYSEAEMLNLTIQDITYPDDLHKDQDLLKKIIRRELSSYTIEKRCIKKNGKMIWVLLTVSAVYDHNNHLVYFVAQADDITMRKHAESELQYQATHDTLTGLFNRREIESRLNVLINDTRTEKNINSLLFIDLDDFKIVNDTAGHAAGDAFLRKISEILIKSIRETDKVARIGGDEFVVILPECTQDSALAIANTIINNLKNYKFRWDDKEYSIGVSIGLVQFRSGEVTMENLLSCADSACYNAKNQGGNRAVVFDYRIRRFDQSPRQ